MIITLQPTCNKNNLLLVIVFRYFSILDIVFACWSKYFGARWPEHCWWKWWYCNCRWWLQRWSLPVMGSTDEFLRGPVFGVGAVGGGVSQWYVVGAVGRAVGCGPPLLQPVTHGLQALQATGRQEHGHTGAQQLCHNTTLLASSEGWMMLKVSTGIGGCCKWALGLLEGVSQPCDWKMVEVSPWNKGWCKSALWLEDGVSQLWDRSMV